MKRKKPVSRSDVINAIVDIQILFAKKRANDYAIEKSLSRLKGMLTESNIGELLSPLGRQKYAHLTPESTIGAVAEAYFQYGKEARTPKASTLSKYRRIIANTDLSRCRIGMDRVDYDEAFESEFGALKPATKRNIQTAFRAVFAFANLMQIIDGSFFDG